ncbi:spore coat protein [Candidatus Gottesmanbacteria bacterium RBG_13_37_7]|uniref:glucose-1-phosphate thymidylyltransferase n=1 Tax=Candidatus Gottesmanbacteria bacterium RBG_13_37_7 TaxID=1798369 RepID=A0A1F5YK29_9BACT|nr:MAG: spore coat protein [Candidatus Gottesmanbacteria bacterium RBG_13_37_7]
MKGVILAGGLGTRLYPLTHATNKHLLPIYNKPMIFYPISTLVKAGVTEILVVTSGPHAGDFIQILKNGKELGVSHLEYAYQEKPDGGIADALLLAEDFSDKKNIIVILGDNTTDASIKNDINNFKSGAVLFLKRINEVNQLKRFGVPRFADNDMTQIIAIEEKPVKPKSNYVATGLYIYDNSVFDIIRKCKPSDRGEIEITDVNNIYIKKNKLKWVELKGFWSDAGTFETLFKANQYWFNKGGL